MRIASMRFFARKVSKTGLLKALLVLLLGFVHVGSVQAADIIAPTVTAFTMPATATSLTVVVSSFTATDDVGVAGYMITESATAPLAGDAGWSATAPTDFTFSGYGARTAYAWAKDAEGNVSASLSAGVTIKQSQIITFNALPAKTYGDADFAPGATASSGLTVTYASSNPAVATIVAGQIHIVGAGTTNITASQAGDATYEGAADVIQPLTVSGAILTVSAQNASRPYGVANPVFTPVYSGFVNGDTAAVLSGAPDLATTATISSPVGSYPITASVGTLAAANYTFSFGSGTLAIDLASQTITFDPLSARTYGDAPFGLTATGGASGNPVTYTSSNPAVATISGATVTIVGAGSTIITASQAGDANYASATAQQTLTVNKATLTVSAQNASRPYGAVNPVFTPVYSGFVNGDTAAVLSGAPDLATTATISSPVGSYPITASVGTLAAANYTFSFGSGTLAIDLASQSITFDPLSARTYGDAPFALTATGGASGNPVTYISSNPAVATISGSTVTIVGAGSTIITASQAGDANYASATAQQPLTVNKATLTVSAENASRPYGAANPVFTPVYSGFVNGDTAAVLSGAPDLTTTAIISSPVGSYPITAAAGNLFSNNYTFTYIAGTFTVNPASLTVMADSKSKTYGSANPALTVSYSGFVNGDTAASLAPQPTATTTATSGSPAGTYPITASGGASSNYTFSYVAGTLTVNPALLTVTADSKSKTQGTANPPLTVSYSGFVNGDTAASLISQPTATTTATTDSPAGTYPITVSGGASSNYTFAYVAGILTVNAKQDQTITFGALAVKTYGDADFAPGATASSGLPVSYASSDPAVATIIGGTIHIVGAGTTSITASQAGDDTYNPAADVIQTLTIDKAAQSITFPAPTDSKTYGAADFGSVATTTSQLTVTYDSSNTSVATVSAATGLVHIVGAGSTIITASLAGDANYNPATAQMTLTVDRAPLTVSAQNASRPYGEANPVFTPVYSGFVNGDTAAVLSGAPDLTTTATISSPAGSYPITASIGTLAAANYTFSFGSGTLAIDLASQSITFDPLSARTYGDAPFALTATGGASGNPVTYTSSNPAVATISGSTVTIVGAGSTVITASQAGDANYASATAQQSLTVDKATLSVSAQNVSRPYGEANPVFTPVYSGFVNGDTAAILSGAPDLATTATISSPAGSYPITASIGTLAAANYTFSFGSGTLAIDLASQIITFDPLSARIYGDVPFDLTATGGASGNPVTYTSSNPAVATISGSTVTIVGAGSTVITASQAGDANYASATAQQPLTVNKATLTVSAENASRPYGVANPVFTPGYSGFVNGDTVAVLSGAPDLTTTATISSPAGSYPVTAAAGNLFSNNYTFSYIAGTLTVSPAILTVTADSKSKTYGTADPALTWSATGYVNGDTGAVVTGSLARTAGENVGNYAITRGTLAAANYTITYIGANLTINAATLTVTADSKSKNYGSANPALTVSYSGFVNSDTAASLITQPTASTIATAGSPVGTYPITASGGASSNYTFSYVAGTLTVNPALLIVTADSTSKTQGTANPPLTVSYSGFVNGDTAASLTTQPTATTTATTDSPAGTYPITVSGGASSNYTFAYVAGTLTVNADVTAPTVTAFTMPATASSLTVSATSFTATDNVAVTGYMITESATAPLAGDAGWRVTAPTSFLFSSSGTRTAYAWAKDAAGNVSTYSTATVTISLASASTLVVTGTASPLTAGSVDSVTVTVKDAYGNTATGYTGTVHLASTDPQAVLPADYTFVSGDAGVHVFSVTLKTAGTWSVTVTDTATPAVTGAQSGIVVNPATANTLVVSGVTSPMAVGVPGSITVTIKDQYGNTATGYTGAIHFTSTDPLATLPADYTFVSGDAGVHAFVSLVTFNTIGTQSITATDKAAPTITGTQAGIIVTPAAASTLVVVGITSPRTAGTTGSITITAKDAHGNTATGYTGTVHFTSTDPQAVLPANYTFVAGDAGVHTFPSLVTLKTVGIQSVTATDTVTPTITGMQSGISVNPTSAGTLLVTGIVSPRAADTAGSVNVTVKDAYGNTVPGYRGTVHFTSTDPQAVLPADYTFVAGDAGVHTFVYLVNLKTVGTQSITATDTVTPGIAGTQSGIVVNTAQAATQAAQIAAGTYHTVALNTDGHVLTWGKNDAGQLGIGTTTDVSAPVDVPGVSNIISIAAGYNHTVALKNDGTVWTWGGNRYGQLGNGATTSQSSPVQVPGITGITAIAAGAYHTVALKSDGTVWAWGDNEYGQVGDGSTIATRTVPVQVQGIVGVTAVAAGGYHSLFLKGDETVWGCGDNNSGQLGDGSVLSHNAPVQAVGLDTMSAIGAGLVHSIALRKDGSVWTWGDNSRGQLGDGSEADSSYPHRLQAITDATGVAGGDIHSTVLRGDGTVWTWGGNSYGQVGDGTTADRYSPAQVQGLSGVVGLAGGGSHTVALMGNGTIWVWGNNTYGQLGDGYTLYKKNYVPTKGFTGTLAVASGANHNVAVKTDGTVWTWGKNAFGQLGDGTLANKSAPLQVTGLAGVVAVAAGANHTVALKGDGTVWAWGANAFGQLGDGSVTDRSLPVQVQGITGVTAIAAGDYFTLALKSDGSVWAWGSNSSGQLGDGTTVNRAAPGMVSGLSSVSAIGAGYLHSMALRADGTVWTWGYNGFGQLGDGTTISKKTPIQANLSQIAAIAAGTHHSLALKSDGTLWAWGYNASGQLGDGTISNRNTPVQTVGIYGVSAIAAGANHSLALMADRSLWSWGDNYFGQLGDGTSTNKSVPQQLGSFTGITAIAAGDNHSVVVKDDSSIWISGNNDSGQLGDGTPYSPGIVPTVILGNDNIPPVTTASLGDGTYSGAQTVMLIANEPATIHFTLDGTTPTINSAIYGDPIPLTSSTVLKYFAVDLAGNVESVNTRTYTITYPNPLSIVVSGSGRVDLSTGGSCSGNCSQLIVAGSTVVLTPVASPGSVFVNWTGCDSVNGQLCTVVMSAAKYVTATFSPAYPLSVNVVESGTVSFSTGGSCTGYCTQNLRAGIQVLLTASATTTVFDGWAGCDSVNGASCTVTMNGARNVTAIFGYLVKTSVGSYLSLQDAYNTAANNDVILARAADFSENVDLNRNVSVTISGGYDRSYSTIIGQSTLHGNLTVTDGTIVVGNLVIQ